MTRMITMIANLVSRQAIQVQHRNNNKHAHKGNPLRIILILPHDDARNSKLQSQQEVLVG